MAGVTGPPHNTRMTGLPMGPETMTAESAAEWLRDARRRTLALADDLTDQQLEVPLLPILNPPLWELGHVGWFQERWLLRHYGGRPPLRADGDALFDSSAVAHDSRWRLPLLSRAATLAYLESVLDRVLATLPTGVLPPDQAYFCWLVVMHEDMHGEAFTYTRQTLGYAPPRTAAAATAADGRPLTGDAVIPGGEFRLGAEPAERAFVFDNEQWAHSVRIAPFAIARAAVTNGEFAAFVGDGGYRRRELWSAEGWTWREGAGAEHPVYWAPEPSGGGPGWRRREFDRWVALGEDLPVIHVNAFEAEAYCAWAGRRLPSEAEWEMAAAGAPAQTAKRRWPWGDALPSDGGVPARWEGRALGCAPVSAYPEGDSAWGCRQMMGNVWEWTASAFRPYPGFSAGPYRDYSQPWFTPEHRVLRGGCWATRARLLRDTWRNFYPAHRRDVFAGFRTCAMHLS
jgi:iron(II)-dependent oxidoreductase